MRLGVEEVSSGDNSREGDRESGDMDGEVNPIGGRTTSDNVEVLGRVKVRAKSSTEVVSIIG